VRPPPPLVLGARATRSLARSCGQPTCACGVGVCISVCISVCTPEPPPSPLRSTCPRFPPLRNPPTQLAARRSLCLRMQPLPLPPPLRYRLQDDQGQGRRVDGRAFLSRVEPFCHSICLLGSRSSAPMPDHRSHPSRWQPARGLTGTQPAGEDRTSYRTRPPEAARSGRVPKPARAATAQRTPPCCVRLVCFGSSNLREELAPSSVFYLVMKIQTPQTVPFVTSAGSKRNTRETKRTHPSICVLCPDTYPVPSA
jgi:hypothetical protein